MKFEIPIIGLIFCTILYYMMINLEHPMWLLYLPFLLFALKHFTREKILPDLMLVVMISRALMFFIWWPLTIK